MTDLQQETLKSGTMHLFEYNIRDRDETSALSSEGKSRRALLLENISPFAVKAFENAGFAVETYSKLTPKELKEKLRNVHVVGVRSKTKLTEDVLSTAEHLIAIGCFCIGTDQTNMKVAASKAVPVFNAPFANTRSVAEAVISCIIALARGIGDSTMQMHNGVWKKVSKERYEVRGKTLGIIGYGHVGSQLSILAEAMGMRVIYYDIQRKLPLGNAQPVASQKELLANSQFVSLHVPMTPQTNNLISSKELAQMQPRSYLVNFARGKVCDTSAVAKALRDEKLAGAAFDVYPQEPAAGERFSSPLQGCPNTILSPHIGGSTEEAQAHIGDEVSNKVISYVRNGNSENACNFPHVSLPEVPEQHRILNVHHNIPGFLRDVNNVLAEYNISAQVLGTNNDIGYLICRTDKGVSQEIGRKIALLDHSIRTRVLD